MNTTLVILLAAMLVFARAEDFKCKIFECGSIDNEGKGPTERVCAQKQEGKDEWKLEACGDVEGKKYLCAANAWGNIDAVVNDDQLCVEDTSGKSENLVAGDKCDADNTCMDGIECTDGVCVGIAAGTACSAAGAHGSCAVGNYCSTDTQCAALKKETEACVATDFCERGLSCIQAEGDDNAKCYKKGTGDTGKKYTTVVDLVPDSGAWLSFCKTNYAKKTGDNEIQCQSPPKNQDSNGDLKKSDSSATVKVMQYKYAEDGTESEDPVEKPAFCGFGSTAAQGFGDKYIGDEDVQTFLKDFDSVFYGEGLECNIVSTLARCAKITDDQLKKLKLGGNALGLTGPKVWAAVAGNDQCAKDTINKAYWADAPIEPDFAFGLSLKTIGAAFVAFTAFVMMF